VTDYAQFMKRFYAEIGRKARLEHNIAEFMVEGG
jgi:hypothetical protein